MFRFNAHYAFIQPLLHITLPVANNVAAQFEEWNTTPLRSPLRQGLG
jgi:hypothetical protein